jgi:uncharacterized protein (DUF302 family)
MYGYKKEVYLSYEEALKKVKDELEKEGFGVLTEIDVKTTLNKKLGVEVDNYAILGACNPPAAYRALQAEPDIGLMLPCNVIVYEKEGKTYVSAIRPTLAMQMIDNDQLKEVALEIEAKLKRVIDNL